MSGFNFAGRILESQEDQKRSLLFCWFLLLPPDLLLWILPQGSAYRSQLFVAKRLISQLFVLMKLLLLTFSKFSLPKELLSPQPHYLSCSSIIERLRVCLNMEKFPAHTFTSRGTFSLYQPPLNSQTTLRYSLCNIDKIGLQILQVHTHSKYRRWLFNFDDAINCCGESSLRPQDVNKYPNGNRTSTDIRAPTDQGTPPWRIDPEGKTSWSAWRLHLHTQRTRHCQDRQGGIEPKSFGRYDKGVWITQRLCARAEHVIWIE